MGCPKLLPLYTGQPSVESLFVSNLMHLSINPTNCMMIMPLKSDIKVETKVNLQFRQYMLSLRPLIFFLINNLSSYLVLKEAIFWSLLLLPFPVDSQVLCQKILLTC